MRRLHVHPLPQCVPPDALERGTAVVIDVLRATTSIVAALDAGAAAVLPCLTVDDARAVAASLPREETLLAGERGGRPIVGFDLGNSPAEFTQQRVRGKRVVFTTTNGTKALLHCRAAADVRVAALVNLSAVCDVLAERPVVDVVCAGTDGQATDEDLLAAGGLVDRLTASGDWKVNDDASAARDRWRDVVGATGDQLHARLRDALGRSRGGRNLIEIDLAADIDDAARCDTSRLVPRYLAASGEIIVP